ncbi:MAG TPA: hypothetical protein VK869_16160 [Rubrobacteraceae bacterium]|nr:hypothetical protein [Rubrobacteraceae bacterium]
MERWGEVNNPLVKAVAAFAVPLFLALNFPAVFLALVTSLLFYALTLLGIAHTYRRQHRIVGRPELVAQLAAKALACLKDESSRTISKGLERHHSRKMLQRERKARIRRYRRERNRRQREQTREVQAQQR